MQPIPRSCCSLCGALCGQCARSSGHQPEPRRAPGHYCCKDGEARPQVPSRQRLRGSTRPTCLYCPRKASLRKTVLLASLRNRHQGGGGPARRSHRRCWSRSTREGSRAGVCQQARSHELADSSRLPGPVFRPEKDLGAPSSQEGGDVVRGWRHPRSRQRKRLEAPSVPAGRDPEEAQPLRPCASLQCSSALEPSVISPLEGKGGCLQRDGLAGPVAGQAP